MIVFKTYFRIIKKQFVQLSIYLIVFMALAILFTFIGSDKSVDTFTQSKAKVAFINQGQDTVLIQGLKDYLSEHSIFVELGDNTVELQDALFFREVEYIVRIPADFTKDFMSGKVVEIDKTTVSGSISGIYTDLLVNKYLNTARLYAKNYKGITQNELVEQVDKDLAIETEVEMKVFKGKAADSTATRSFYNFMPYVLINIIILGVSSIMMVFNDVKLKRRNLCSPVSNTSVNIQILLGNIVFSVSCWAFLVIISFILYRQDMFEMNALFFCINSLVLTLTILSMSFLIGILIKSKNAQAGVSNILSLGMCFLSGVFVPQEFLGENVLYIAKFLPTYWYIKANKAVSDLSNFNFDNIGPIISYMLIELGFAAAIISITLVLSKRKQLKGA